MSIGDVRGKTVLVVGGGRGIGQAIAERFAELGAEVGLTGRDAGRTAEVAGSIAEAYSAKVTGHALDVTDRARVREVVEEFRAERGGADVLIYNAGISPSYASAEKVEEKDWDDILATNLTGAFCAAQAFARPLIVDGAPGPSCSSHAVSVRTVYRLFERNGDTFRQVVRARKLDRARQELADGDHPVASIAARWGFADASHFSRSFKTAFGVSPREFRAASTLQAGSIPPPS
jgi:NAD(P)-dependent dehydrogenase (short-subunit alcohol dehydrogenase family)